MQTDVSVYIKRLTIKTAVDFSKIYTYLKVGKYLVFRDVLFMWYYHLVEYLLCSRSCFYETKDYLLMSSLVRK